MKLGTIVVILALLCLPIPALADIELTWDNCATADGAAGEPAPQAAKTFDCASPHTYALHGSFKAPADLPTFIAMAITIDVTWWSSKTALANEPLEPFWHFETGGCNSAGIVLSANKSASGGCSLYASPWGEHGEEAFEATIALYGPDYLEPGRGRILADVIRATSNPFPLVDGTDYYGFHLLFSTNAAGSCAGCEDWMVLMWNSVTLLSASPDIPPVVLTGPFSYAWINHDPFLIGDPVRPTTWGQIKAQYH